MFEHSRYSHVVEVQGIRYLVLVVPEALCPTLPGNNREERTVREVTSVSKMIQGGSQG